MSADVGNDAERILRERARETIGADLGGSGRARPISRTLSEVLPEQVTWLSPGRIPFGKVTVIEGDPGLGKSTMLLDLAARLTRGEGFPGDPPMEASDVILLTAEDGIADTVLPRLQAAGADCTRVHTLDGFIRYDGKVGDIVLGDPDDPASLEALEERIAETGARLVIVDVLSAFLSGARDSYRDADMRAALRPLAALAERMGCAIVVVRHLRKASGGKAITAGGGSIAISGAARSVLLVDADPDDAARRVLASVKCNLAAPPSSLVFRIEGADAGSSRIVWLGVSEHTAESLTEARGDDQSEAAEPSKGDECADCLREWLAAGPMDRKEVMKLGTARGFSPSVVERAKREIGVVHERSGFGAESRSMWTLRPLTSTESSSVTPSPADSDDEIDDDDGTDEPRTPNPPAGPVLLTDPSPVKPSQTPDDDGTERLDGTGGTPPEPDATDEVTAAPLAGSSAVPHRAPDWRPSWARSPIQPAALPLFDGGRVENVNTPLDAHGGADGEDT